MDSAVQQEELAGQVVPDTQDGQERGQNEQITQKKCYQSLELQVVTGNDGEHFQQSLQVGSDYSSDSSVTTSEVERNEVMLAQELIPIGAEVEVVTDHSTGEYKVQVCERLAQDARAHNGFEIACAEDAR